MNTRSDELNRFKTEINLCEYAVSIGFVLDRKESSRANAVLRHPSGDKVIVSRKQGGHWIYFNVHGNDSGTIIDFIQSRSRTSLGQIRKQLRQWTGGGQVSTQTDPQFQLKPHSRGTGQVHARWLKANRLKNGSYLETDRGIAWASLNDPVFENRIRTDHRRNVLFPHTDLYGNVCGFEIKNKGFTGFSPGGTKSIWTSVKRGNDQIAVLSESAIDGLSFASLFGTTNKRFFSTAGQTSPLQKRAILSTLQSMKGLEEIWLAFDHDEAGKKLAATFESFLPTSIPIHRKLPPKIGSDWNDELRHPSNRNDRRLDRA